MSWTQNSKLYIGEVRSWCDCHGFTRAWTIKVHRLFSATWRGKAHYPRLFLRFGQEAEIKFARPEKWKMMGERIDR